MNGVRDMNGFFGNGLTAAGAGFGSSSFIFGIIGLRAAGAELEVKGNEGVDVGADKEAVVDELDLGKESEGDNELGLGATLGEAKRTSSLSLSVEVVSPCFRLAPAVLLSEESEEDLAEGGL